MKKYIVLALALMFSTPALSAKVEWQDERILRVSQANQSPEKARTKILKRTAKAARSKGYNHFAAVDWVSTPRQDYVTDVRPDRSWGDMDKRSVVVYEVSGRFALLETSDVEELKRDHPHIEWFSVESILD